MIHPKLANPRFVTEVARNQQVGPRGRRVGGLVTRFGDTAPASRDAGGPPRTETVRPGREPSP